MTRNCRTCGEPINQRRLDALPNTRVCLKCSDEAPVKGFMTWEHKTAPTINIVNQEQHVRAQAMSRRGFHAQLGVNSYNNPRLVGSVRAAQTGRDVAELVRESNRPVDVLAVGETSNTVIPVPVTHPASRCHPERPKATSDGKCLECAVAWYQTHKR